MIRLQAIIECLASHESIKALKAGVYGGHVPGGKELWPAISISWADPDLPIRDRKIVRARFFGSDDLRDALYDICRAGTCGDLRFRLVEDEDDSEESLTFEVAPAQS